MVSTRSASQLDRPRSRALVAVPNVVFARLVPQLLILTRFVRLNTSRAKLHLRALVSEPGDAGVLDQAEVQVREAGAAIRAASQVSLASWRRGGKSES